MGCGAAKPRISPPPLASAQIGCTAIRARSHNDVYTVDGQRVDMTPGDVTDRVAVVTGASKSIGAGAAKPVATEGTSVVVNYATRRRNADKVVADITSKGS